jgi:hypothetical protein
MQSREEALVDAFIVPEKRERYKTFRANPKRRAKLLDGLNHCRDLDPRYATEIPSGTDVVSLLRKRGAPERCHVISDVTELDGREMALQEAIDETESHMWGTLIGCVPGRLAYYYGEAGEQRLLLERATNKPLQPTGFAGGRHM